MSMKLILLCGEGDARQAYSKAIESLGVQVDSVSSFSELLKAMSHIPYNGIVFDLTTKIKRTKDEREVPYNILEMFPTIQLTWESKTKGVRTLYYGKSKKAGSMEDFINEVCQPFKSRIIRSYIRQKYNFNVVLSKDSGFLKKYIESTVTIDISMGGCFIYSNTNWERTSNAYFIIKELDDNTPILGEVRWRLLWGKAMRIPGIGIRFKSIKMCQVEELAANFKI